MFKYFFQLIILSGFCSAQAFEVQNVTASQRTDGSHIVDVCYDLEEDDVFVSFRTSMEISLDGGANWQILIVPIMPNVMGDNVLPGDAKCFIIELDDFFSNTYSSSVQVKVIAEGHEAITLPWEDEMILIESGPFMSFGVNFNTPEFQHGDTLLDIDYDYEIMKYEVTNAQYAQFLIEAVESGYIDWGCGYDSWGPVCVHFPGYATWGADGYYGWDIGNDGTPGFYGELVAGLYRVISGTDTWYEGTTSGKIDWNGTTFIVEEGRGNHPITHVSGLGMWAFANYYGLRVPDINEWTKAARGTSENQWAYGETPAENRANFDNSGDPWDYQITGQSYTNVFTPVGFYNGQTYQGYQTIDSPSPYGTYDQSGNAAELVMTVSDVSQWGSIGVLILGKNAIYNHYTHILWNAGSTSDDGGNESMQYSGDDHGTTGFRCVRTVNNSQ